MHARMLIKDAFARYAEEGFGGCDQPMALAAAGKPDASLLID